MSAPVWRLDPLEFVVLWKQSGLVRLPYPLQYRATATLADEHRRDRRNAAAAVKNHLDDDLYRALTILAEPELSCAAYGLDGIGTSGEQVVRAHVGVRGRAAALARQRPGRTEDAGGAIDLELVSVAALPAKLAATLPRRRAAKGDVLVTNAAELADAPLLADAVAESARERLKAMLARPRRSAGEVTVCRRQAVTPTAGFAWRDCDNGRYLVEHADDGNLTIRPGTSAAVATCIRAALNTAQQKEDS